MSPQNHDYGDTCDECEGLIIRAHGLSIKANCIKVVSEHKNSVDTPVDSEKHFLPDSATPAILPSQAHLHNPFLLTHFVKFHSDSPPPDILAIDSIRRI